MTHVDEFRLNEPWSALRSSGDLLADRRYEFAVAYAAEGDFQAAAELLEQVIERAPSGLQPGRRLRRHARRWAKALPQLPPSRRPPRSTPRTNWARACSWRGLAQKRRLMRRRNAISKVSSINMRLGSRPISSMRLTIADRRNSWQPSNAYVPADLRILSISAAARACAVRPSARRPIFSLASISRP